ncbi:MAG: RHS repeat-associated core domain-containing protein [Acidimicrobiales bacterium]
MALDIQIAGVQGRLYSYKGQYGENASGGSPPSNTALAAGSYGYNGQQGKLTDGNLILMGARPYQPSDGRFLQVDPIQGGCANNYTYAFGDPINNPDLSGEGWFHSLTHWVGCHIGAIATVAAFGTCVVASFGVCAVATGVALVARVGQRISQEGFDNSLGQNL